MTKTYKFVVRFTCEGMRCHDDYCCIRDTMEEALDLVKMTWHKDNDHRFPKVVDPEFFVEADSNE